MPLFRRRPSLPTDVRARLDLRGDDRVVAVAELRDGWAVASVRALHLVRAHDGADMPGHGAVTRRPWSDVDRASLDPDTATLTVVWVEGPADRLHLASDRAQPFPVVLRERVQSSVVHSESVTLRDGRRLRVALRRTEDAGLVTQVIGDGRVDLTDPAVAVLVDAAEARVRDAAGLPP